MSTTLGQELKHRSPSQGYEPNEERSCGSVLACLKFRKSEAEPDKIHLFDGSANAIPETKIAPEKLLVRLESE